MFAKKNIKPNFLMELKVDAIGDILEIENRQLWVTAFWGFKPQDSGMVGFTNDTDRDKFFDNCRDGDLVLIYGATEGSEKKDQGQALGFVEIKRKKLNHNEKRSDDHMLWKRSRGKENSWNYGVEVVRAWEVEQKIPIKYILKTDINVAVRGVIIYGEKRQSALALRVRPINVYGEDPVAHTEPVYMQHALKGPRGLPATFGKIEFERTDGIHYVYLMIARGPVAVVLGLFDHELNGRDLVKVGYSKNPEDRCKAFNHALPDTFAFRWVLHSKTYEFPNGEAARAAEKEIHQNLMKIAEYYGGEFFLGNLNRILGELHITAGFPVIKGRTLKN